MAKTEQFTKEQIEKAMACKTAEELMAAAKAEGYELTKDEAEAYLAELSDFELDEETMRAAAGGDVKSCYIIEGCATKICSRVEL